MNYSAPVSAPSKHETSPAAGGHAKHDSFARSLHFALALTPMILAVAAILLRDFHGQPVVFRVIVFCAFFFSISAALYFLRALDQLIDKDV